MEGEGGGAASDLEKAIYVEGGEGNVRFSIYHLRLEPGDDLPGKSHRPTEMKDILMAEIIDLSQEIYTGMPTFPGMPDVEVSVHASHEQWDHISDSDVVSPAVNRLSFGEHTGTHVDAINHMGRQYRGQSIDTMPLTTFYTEGICLDVSDKGLRQLIEPKDLEKALQAAGLDIRQGDAVLLYTDHYRRAFGTDGWHRGPGAERGCGALAGRAAHRGLRRGASRAGCAARIEQGCASGLRKDGLHPLREPAQPAPARWTGPVPFYRLAAEDTRRDRLTGEGGGGVRELRSKKKVERRKWFKRRLK